MIVTTTPGYITNALTTALRTDSNSWTGPLGAEPTDDDDLQLTLRICVPSAPCRR